MKRIWPIALLLPALLVVPSLDHGYPLDLYEETGIERLRAYSLAAKGEVKGATLYPGALQPASFVRLHLADRPEFEIPGPDAALSKKLAGLLGEDAPHYGVTLLDLTDPDEPRYAEHQATRQQNPGSVGKVMVALALLQSLADAYPDDLAARRKVLRETSVVADEFIRHDHHEVPFWSPGDPRITKRPIHEGDTANLWTYLDWMCSASSNAAASMVLRELVLLSHFGREYPVSPERARAYLDETPATELGKSFVDVLVGTLARNGIDSEQLRQGGFFTRRGKHLVPGTSSRATARELMRLLVRLEQGKLVDRFSSQELKRLLYLTDRRIRYASSPALSKTAVFYKSGSLYSCKPEPEFKCYKYHGNVKNYMNSVAVVETVGRDPDLHYLTVVTSNVLRKNSAVAHQTLATRIHRLIEAAHPVAAPPEEAPPSGE